MIASRFAVAVLVLASVMGSFRVENAACRLSHDTRFMYVVAQIRMAVGDREGGLKLMRQVSTAEHQKSEYTAHRTLCAGQSS